MAIRCELAPDRERGPGHGLVNIASLRGLSGEVDFTLQRNHGTDPFLGPNGKWQSAEYWHRASVRPGEAAGLNLVIPFGPELVDPIVEQPANVAYLLTVGLASAKQSGALKIDRSLLGSKAAALAPPPAPQPVPEKLEQEKPSPAPPPIKGLEDQKQGKSEQQEGAAELTPPPVLGKRQALISASALVLLLALGAGLWWGCYVPVMSPGHCPVKEQVTDGVSKGSKKKDQPPPSDPPPAVTPESCTGLQAEDCLSLALKALEERRLEPAHQLLKRASRLGSAKANVHLAEMYDPGTWSTNTSPMDQPDWETASYWYEEAARQGELKAMIAAGRLYCEHSSNPVFRDHGLSLLRKAAAAPGAGAAVQQLLKACEEKAQ